MKLNIIIFFLSCFIVSLLNSCTNKHESNIQYIIKHSKNSTNDVDKIDVPLFFYGNHNFILTNSSKVYYYSPVHKKTNGYTCGNGIDFTKPPHIYLIPDNLIEIRSQDLVLFLKKNINIKIRHNYISISSPTDTIRNKAFKIIMNYMNSNKENPIVIRNWTEEEEVVTLSKILNKKYQPYGRKWKNKFDQEPPPPYRFIQFIPPIVDIQYKSKKIKSTPEIDISIIKNKEIKIEIVQLAPTDFKSFQQREFRVISNDSIFQFNIR